MIWHQKFGYNCTSKGALTTKRTKAIDDRLLTLDALLNGTRPMSKLESLCIQRQIKDLSEVGNNGLVWDEEEAVRAREFSKLMCHWKGKQFAGKSFNPEPWQDQLIIAPLFGWRRENDFSGKLVRRFNEGYSEVPRKNGKTFLASLIANQGLLADGEQGPEVYSAAALKDQAAIVFTDCRNTLKNSPHLLKYVTIRQHHIECESNGGILRAVSSDYNFLQGKGPSRVVVDELHAHRTRATYDALISGMGARENWLLYCITTAGYDRSSICFDRHEYARKVLEGHVEDDTFFAFIACAEDGDDFSDPEIWHKANPNLNVSVFPDFLKREAKQARDSAPKENVFRRLHLNQWTEQSVRWIQMEAWDACRRQYNEADLYGQRCFVGLDLANTRDVNALVLVFPQDGGEYKVLPYFWIPRDHKDLPGASERRQIKAWADQGYVTQTEGNVADFDDQIPRDIVRILSDFDVADIAYDPWGPAVGVVQRLSREINPNVFTEFRQTMANFAGPCKEFERLIAQGKMHHDGNPVLRWMASCVSVKSDPSGNIRPDKQSSSDKIDGIVAEIMGLSRAIIDSTTPSVYESRGLLTF